MANYCARCGKALPEGAELCPDCQAAARENGAAPFTMITAETETWRGGADREKKQRTRTQTQRLWYTVAAAAAVLAAVCVILYIQPVNRAVRAIRAGEYDRALEIYWRSASLSGGQQDARISREAKRAADSVCDAYAAHALDTEEAAAALSRLGGLGSDGETLLAEELARFRAHMASREHMDVAEVLSLNGEYLAAREEYLLVAEDDADFADAQEQARLSLDRYAESVISDANVFIQSGDYASAILSLEAGERALLTLEAYNEALDYKLKATYELFEAQLLSDAREKAMEQNYTAAAELLRENMERFDFETETLTETMAGYLADARDKALADRTAQAEELYAAGDYEGAFRLLDEIRGDPDVSPVELGTAVADLEARYAAQKNGEAREAFAGARENLPAAVAVLTEALRVREVEAIETYRAELEQYLPASLAEIEYARKEGTIFRSPSTFEGLDGVNYTEGWVWGENGAELIFTLDGGYDLLEGTLAVRRDDGAEVSGSLEVLCDGETVYASETLHHFDGVSIPVSVDITGCAELTLRFVTDYSVRTAENGYCYHGFCGPTVTKNLE